MKVNFLLILFFIIFNNLNANAFPDKIKIKLDPKNFGKYQKNIFRAYVSDGNHIKERFKKWTDAKIITKDKDLRIKLRITGDWKDHLGSLSRRSMNVYSSILIKVIDDNYEGMTRFKILLPENKKLSGLHGAIQHLTLATLDVQKIVNFYQGKLGFRLVDRVLHSDGSLATAFLTSNREHHTLACFKSDLQGVDHHSYEVGEWNLIRDWCDHFSRLGIEIVWGPGRHGPGNNLFAFIKDKDENWIEISAELEKIFDRDVMDWPQEPRTLNKWGYALLRS